MRDRAAMLPSLQIVAHRAWIAHLTLLQLRSALGVPIQNATLELEQLRKNSANMIDRSFDDMDPRLRAELLPIVHEELQMLVEHLEPGALKLDAALAKMGRA